MDFQGTSVKSRALVSGITQRNSLSRSHFSRRFHKLLHATLLCLEETKRQQLSAANINFIGIVCYGTKISNSSWKDFRNENEDAVSNP